MAKMFSTTIWSLKYFVHNWRKNFQHNKFIPEINVAFPTPTSIKIFTKLFFEKYHNILFPKSFLWGNYKVLIPIIWEMACISMVDFIFPFCNKLALNKTRRIFFDLTSIHYRCYKQSDIVIPILPACSKHKRVCDHENCNTHNSYAETNDLKAGFSLIFWLPRYNFFLFAVGIYGYLFCN